MAVPSTSSGSVADDTYPPSAAIDADRQNCSCSSLNDPTNTGRRDSAACVAQKPDSAGKRR